VLALEALNEDRDVTFFFIGRGITVAKKGGLQGEQGQALLQKWKKRSPKERAS